MTGRSVSWCCALVVVIGVVAGACRESDVRKVGAASTPLAATDEPARPAHGAGRDRWKGGGVYLDGVAIGMLRYGELPRGLTPVWEVQRRRLPFRAGEPVREVERRVPRFRIVDYLAALGVDVADVQQLHLHGGRDGAIVIRGEDLRGHPDQLLFRFADDTAGKPIPVIRDVPVNTSFDDLQAMAIYVARTPPTLTRDQMLELEGAPVRGIPYRGQPLREGVRVYRDDRLVAVLKRNEMPPGARSHLGDALARAGVATDGLAQVELIHDDVRTERLPWADYELAFDPAASGELAIAERPASALALYSSTCARREHGAPCMLPAR